MCVLCQRITNASQTIDREKQNTQWERDYYYVRYIATNIFHFSRNPKSNFLPEVYELICLTLSWFPCVVVWVFGKFTYNDRCVHTLTYVCLLVIQPASLLGLLACLYVSFYMCLYEYCGRNIVMNFFFVIGLFIMIEMRWNVLFRIKTIDEIYSFYYCCYNISVIRSAVTNSIFSISFNLISLKLTFVGKFTLFFAFDIRIALRYRLHIMMMTMMMNFTWELSTTQQITAQYNHVIYLNH